MTDKKKIRRSVERNGVVKIKNTGKGQAQGQAVNINIKIGDTSKKKKKETEEEELKKKKAKKRRATKRAKKKLIESIQGELETIRNLKDLAKEKNIIIPEELGELPTEVPNSMKGLVSFQQEMADRVNALQMFIQEKETPSISGSTVQPRIIQSGVPSADILYQQELIRARQQLVDQGNKSSGVTPEPTPKPAEPAETDDEILKREQKEREERDRIKMEQLLTPPTPDDGTIGLVEKLLDENIKKKKRELDEQVKQGLITQEDAQKQLNSIITQAKEEEDKDVEGQLGETEKEEFESLEKDKENYQRKAKQIASDIIKASKAKGSNEYVITKRDVEELDFEREDNLIKSQNYQTKNAKIIKENAEIFGEFFRNSDIIYQPNTSKNLIKAFILKKEKDFIEQPETPIVKPPEIPDDRFEAEFTEIRMESRDITNRIQQETSPTGKTTEALLNDVQTGLEDITRRFMIIKEKLKDKKISKETRAFIIRELDAINKNRNYANKYLIKVRDGKMPIIGIGDLDPEKEKGLKQLKKFIATRKKGDIKGDYTKSGFKSLFGNKPMWDAITFSRDDNFKYSNLQQQLDDFETQNPQYTGAGVQVPPIVVEQPFVKFSIAKERGGKDKPDKIKKQIDELTDDFAALNPGSFDEGGSVRKISYAPPGAPELMTM